jgi:hypothetical protein
MLRYNKAENINGAFAKWQAHRYQLGQWVYPAEA